MKSWDVSNLLRTSKLFELILIRHSFLAGQGFRTFFLRFLRPRSYLLVPLTD